PDAWRADDVAVRFDRLLDVRAAVTKAIEEARQGGVVKQSSEARVVLGAEGVDGLAALLTACRLELPALFLTAEVGFENGTRGAESPVLPGLRVRVERA